MVNLVKPRGRITLVHRADRIDEIVTRLSDATGDLTIIPLWPKLGHAAKRVIVTARSQVRGPAVVHPGLVLHNSDGSYTSKARSILEDGKAFDVSL
jgi:tRNA1(Val) A37 N6-methylase TrmN6